MKKLVAIIVFLSIFLFTAHLSFGADEPMSEPMIFVKSTIDRVIDILGDPQYVGNKYRQREDIFSAISPAFSFDLMSSRTLALKWKKISDREKKEFINEFSRLILNSYYLRISQAISEEGSDIKDIKILYVKTIFQKNRELGEIYTIIINKKKRTETPVSYRVIFLKENWFVYDVVVAGVCLVQNYRQQFFSSSIEKIIEGLREKNTENDKLL